VTDLVGAPRMATGTGAERAVQLEPEMAGAGEAVTQEPRHPGPEWSQDGEMAPPTCPAPAENVGEPPRLPESRMSVGSHVFS